MKQLACLLSLTTVVLSPSVTAESRHSGTVGDAVIAKQRLNLKKNTQGKGFGPQSPRNIDSLSGNNQIVFAAAPAYNEMHLCNIHFHKSAEHAGGQYAKYAGNGDGNGYQTGYVYSGKLTQGEILPVSREICSGKHGSLQSGDTIEVHYVHSSAQVKPGPTLGACLSDSIKNPQLRVEAQVVVLVNDSSAMNFMVLAKLGQKNTFYQALNIPDNTGTPIVYSGSTTGPGYNEVGSPFQVTWSVRPNVAKVNIETVGKWCEENVFNENHAHGVRNLVMNTDLLSPIEQ
ncbi:delta-class carbonic anhydrase [Microbulbifer sp. 2205BS26-8]|uniref:delta-class carbonic anhydrase n=1 Tax=Microbulbifer sp. 2205BS26-8 TaxID=3064386 RepID=UPI00273D9434|nr:delta-class carbonic anhydrase [Microbulbifer sp. 2205BS26-8]MDP5209030.1 delta-class carbonic anhydrase [Microbulbifer sp. 2205BS26-8]